MKHDASALRSAIGAQNLPKLQRAYLKDVWGKDGTAVADAITSYPLIAHYTFWGERSTNIRQFAAAVKKNPDAVTEEGVVIPLAPVGTITVCPESLVNPVIIDSITTLLSSPSTRDRIHATSKLMMAFQGEYAAEEMRKQRSSSLK